MPVKCFCTKDICTPKRTRLGLLYDGNGAVTKDIEISTLIRIVPHTHDPNPDSVAASRLKSTTKNKSGTSRGTPTQILVETTATARTEICCALGNPKVVKRTLHRDGAKHLLPNPQSLQDLVVDHQ